ncbi:MAG: SUMF1/EgtB/PvdO family nonheme iron enzyme [Acidobacteriota bacterium]
MDLKAFVDDVLAHITPFVPFLSQPGDANSGSKPPTSKGKALWHAVRPALEARPAAREAAEDLADDPDDRMALAVVGHQLRKALQADPALLAELRALAPSTPAPQSAHATRSVSTVGSGASAGPGSAVSGERGFSFHRVGRDVVIGGETHRPDPATLERAYLHRLVRETSAIPLAGIDPGARSDADVQLSLHGVYTALRTRESRPAKTQADGDAAKLAPGDRLDQAPASALEWLDAEPHLVILGDPGGGKSTFVSFVALCLAAERLGPEAPGLEGLGLGLDTLRAPLPEDDGNAGDEPQPWSHGALLPVRIVLRDFAARGLPATGRADAHALWSFVAAELEAAELGDFAAPLKQALQTAGGLLLLDGLDEVPQADQRRHQLRGAVLGFEKSFPRVRIVVTSRIYPYRNQGWRLAGFAEAALAPFSHGQIRRFTRCWYQQMVALDRLRPEAAAARADQLERAIFGSSRLQYLAERPLLLTLMASLHAWRGGTLPEKRERLYADTVELLLDFWERQRIVPDADGQPVHSPALAEWLETDKESVHRALERLAFQAHSTQADLEGTADLSEGAVLQALLRLRPGGSAERLVDYLRDRTGLLEPRGVGVYTFPHRTFQEYLAACHLTNSGGKPEIKRLATTDPDRWREVALLAGAKLGAGGLWEIWDLAYRLCHGAPEPGTETDPAAAWGAQIAAQLVVEMARDRAALEDLDASERQTLERLRRWMLHLLRSDWPVAERALSGDLLGALGDPRFDPDCLHFPAEPMKGFVEIPAGPFLMGSNPGLDEGAQEEETPQHEVDLPTYWMARFPVTVAQFAAFVQATGYDVDRKALVDPLYRPVAYIAWDDARAYCRWVTTALLELPATSLPEEDPLRRLLETGHEIRLPTEAEWEKAARGKDGQIYPWGGPYEPGRCHDGLNGLVRTTAVGCFPDGASPLGCEEMSGNVWEWTSTAWGKSWGSPDWSYPYQMDEREVVGEASETLRVVRGGSFFLHLVNLRCAARGRDHPLDRGVGLGFRVVLSPISDL